ncbi:hypothetical protein IWQ62_002758, partial [Dispira parvispora]
TDNTVVLTSKFKSLPVWFTYATKWIPLDVNQSHAATLHHDVTLFQPTTLWSFLVALVLLCTLSTTLYYNLDLGQSVSTTVGEQGEQNTGEVRLAGLNQFRINLPTESLANPEQGIDDGRWTQDNITRMMSYDVSFPEWFTFL